MRALKQRPQARQVHLNPRRILLLFTGTTDTTSLCLVRFQIISQHTQRISSHTHPPFTAHSEVFTLRITLDVPTPLGMIFQNDVGCPGTGIKGGCRMNPERQDHTRMPPDRAAEQSVVKYDLSTSESE